MVDNFLRKLFSYRPSKVCSLCNLGERSQLGQGEFLRVKKPDSFVEEKHSEPDATPNVDLPKVKDIVPYKNKKSVRLVLCSSMFTFLSKRNTIFIHQF